MAYVRHCIEAAAAMGSHNLGGPLYSAVGRTWQATADERAAYTDLLVDQLTGACRRMPRTTASCWGSSR